MTYLMQVAQGGSSQSNQAGHLVVANAAPVSTLQNSLLGTIDATGIGAPIATMTLDNGTQVIPVVGAAGNNFTCQYHLCCGFLVIDITARVRNLENILWVTTATANIGNSNVYNLSCGSSLGTEASS
jgi:hypothetical protein